MCYTWQEVFWSSGNRFPLTPLVRRIEGVINRKKIGLEGSKRNKKFSKSYRADQDLRNTTETGGQRAVAEEWLQRNGFAKEFS